MPSPSPMLPRTGLATFILVLGDNSLDSSTFLVSSITVTKGINRISEACIKLVNFISATDSDDFQLGQPIEVLVGYNSSHNPIFKGRVLGLALASGGGTGSVLTVLCQAEAVKTNGNQVTKPMAPQTTSVELVYGTNVEDFSLRIDAQTQSAAIRTAAEVDQTGMQSLADADPTKQTLGLLHGTVDTAGTNTAVLGTMANLSGFARLFNGLAFISGIRHTITDTWITQLSLGADEQGVAGHHPNVGEPVKANGVVLGFWGDDVRSPVILGALDGKERASAYSPDEKNSKKAIVTSSRLTLEFDDDKKVITLITPGNNQLIISDGAKGLTLTDQQQNSITLSDQGLALVSKSGLSISAEQDIQITSTGGSVNIQAGQQVALKGLNVSVTADVDLSLSGTATAALKGGTETTIRGAMVMIN